MDEYVTFECFNCGAENVVDIDEFVGEEECEECGEINEVEIIDEESDEEYEYEDF